MIILSFDCAIKNLGICCVEVNDKWRDEVSVVIEDLYKFYDTINTFADRSVFLKEVAKFLKRIDTILNSMFQIKFLNIIDLIPGKKVNSVKFKEILKPLKYTLYCLDKQLAENSIIPDIVLIESQMNINDKARGVSRYIEEFYTKVTLDDMVSITYAIEAYPFKIYDPPKTQQCEVIIVSPTLKNGYKTDPSELGDYATYIEKYTNYTANKKHTTRNFSYFMETFDKKKELASINNKLDDIADAFMMAFAWCKHKEII